MEYAERSLSSERFTILLANQSLIMYMFILQNIYLASVVFQFGNRSKRLGYVEDDEYDG